MWLQIDVNTDGQEADLVAEILMALGSEAVTFLALDKERIIEANKGDVSLWQHTCVRALFPIATCFDDIKKTLQKQAKVKCITAVELADKNWQQAVDEALKPMCFNNKLWLVANNSHVALVKKDDVVIYLTPGLAFGSGSHPSTQLCLDYLTRSPPQGLTVIDYGCGSGVLAIAAAKLGAKNVIAVDNDASALAVCRENARKNNVFIDVRNIDDLNGIKADLILANIVASTLIELAPQLQSLLKQSGQLLLAGVLLGQADWVKKAYPVMTFTSEAKQDWCCLLGKMTLGAQ